MYMTGDRVMVLVSEGRHIGERVEKAGTVKYAETRFGMSRKPYYFLMVCVVLDGDEWDERKWFILDKVRR